MLVLLAQYLFYAAILGYVADSYMEKTQDERLRNFLLRISNKINEASVTAWAVKILEKGVQAMRYILRFDEPEESKNNTATPEDAKAFVRFYFFFIVVGIAGTYYGNFFNIPSIFPVNNWVSYIPITLIFPILFFSFISIPIFLVLRLFDRAGGWSFYLDFARNTLGVVRFTLFSTVLTTASLFISIYYIPATLPHSVWFDLKDGGGIVPNIDSLLLLYFLNFIFDYGTIMLSCCIFDAFLSRRERYRSPLPVIGMMALFDIIASAVFTVALYAMLLGVHFDPGHHEIFQDFVQTFVDSVWWFQSVVTAFFHSLGGEAGAFSQIPNVHLLPILLTTFIPITIFSVSLLLITISKPIMRIIKGFFEKIGYGQKTVALQFSFLMWSLVGIILIIKDIF